LDRRVEEWSAVLKPADALERWQVRLLALASLRMDRAFEEECKLRAMNIRRDALNWDLERRLQAEQLGRRLDEDPLGVMLQLQRPSDGCVWLSQHWSYLAEGLADGRCAWGEADLERSLDLLGLRPETRALDAYAREWSDLCRQARAGSAEAVA